MIWLLLPKPFPVQIFPKSATKMCFPKYFFRSRDQKGLRIRNGRVNFFSIAADPILETWKLTLNSLTGIFFKVSKHKYKTAILQIKFLETIYFGICMEIAKFFWRNTLPENPYKVGAKHVFLKIFNFHSVWFPRASEMRFSDC